ncbi:MAG: fumarylacetoacetate hydrolase family protein [Solirubrobacterales bacterium]
MSGGALPQRIGVARVDGMAEIVAAYGDRVVSLTAALGWDHGRSVELVRRWEELAPRLEEIGESAAALDEATLRWEPPIMPSKLLCVGANYSDHLEEMERAGAPKIEATPFPFSFLKPPTTALVGSGTEVAIPGFGDELDWEAELAVVIGRPELAASDPLAAIFGYAVLDELSLRDFVAPFPHPLGLDAVICKGWDGSAPMGPWITLAAAAGDPTSMPIELRVNGEVKQRSSTAKMIFTVAEMVAFYARVLTLEVGDVIATGTPAGVGAGKQPPEFLAAGDVVEAEIGGLGTLRTPIVAPRGDVSLDIHRA